MQNLRVAVQTKTRATDGHLLSDEKHDRHGHHTSNL